MRTSTFVKIAAGIAIVATLGSCSTGQFYRKHGTARHVQGTIQPIERTKKADSGTGLLVDGNAEASRRLDTILKRLGQECSRLEMDIATGKRPWLLIETERKVNKSAVMLLGARPGLLGVDGIEDILTGIAGRFVLFDFTDKQGMQDSLCDIFLRFAQIRNHVNWALPASVGKPSLPDFCRAFRKAMKTDSIGYRNDGKYGITAMREMNCLYSGVLFIQLGREHGLDLVGGRGIDTKGGYGHFVAAERGKNGEISNIIETTRLLYNKRIESTILKLKKNIAVDKKDLAELENQYAKASRKKSADDEDNLKGQIENNRKYLAYEENALMKFETGACTFNEWKADGEQDYAGFRFVFFELDYPGEVVLPQRLIGEPVGF